MTFSKFFLLTILLGLTKSNLAEEVCSNVKPMKDFDSSLFSGVWYTYSKTESFGILTGGEGCDFGSYFHLENGSIGFLLAQITNLADGQAENMIYGQGIPLEKGIATFKPEYKSSINLAGDYYCILGTDYKTYAVTFGCDNGKDHYFISTREPIPNEDNVAKSSVMEILLNNDLDSNQLIKVDQSYCF